MGRWWRCSWGGGGGVGRWGVGGGGGGVAGVGRWGVGGGGVAGLVEDMSHPEDVVDEQAGQQQAGHLEAGQPHEGDHGHAEPHGQR